MVNLGQLCASTIIVEWCLRTCMHRRLVLWVSSQDQESPARTRSSTVGSLLSIAQSGFQEEGIKISSCVWDPVADHFVALLSWTKAFPSKHWTLLYSP